VGLTSGSVGTEVSFSRVKRYGREVAHSIPSSVEFRNSRRCKTSTLPYSLRVNPEEENCKIF
jgi:hypothetical protein